MKVLVIEDDEKSIDFLEGELQKINNISYSLAKSRDSALRQISEGLFDVIVLDLKIPTGDAMLDPDRSHGLSVHGHILIEAPGTPVVVWSAYGDISVVRKLGEERAHGDPWGRGTDSALSIFKEKTELGECLAYLREAAAEVERLRQIEISTAGENLHLEEGHKRVLRIFARQKGGSVVRVRSLRGGLSSAKALIVDVSNLDGGSIAMAVAKLGALTDLAKERSRYDQHIVPILGVGAFAHEIRYISSGAGKMGGLFYGFAETYSESALDLLVRDPQLASTMVQSLRAHEEKWLTNGKIKRVNISEIRRALLDDEDMNRLAVKLPFDWREFESMEVTVKMCSQHRDMHFLNVLSTTKGVPILIDYGEVGEAPGCLDPLTLELSLLFHPAAREFRKEWANVTRGATWADLDAYSRDLPCSAFVRACRAWAFEANQSDHGVYATAYAYAVRQLNYETDHDLAISIATAARAALMS